MWILFYWKFTSFSVVKNFENRLRFDDVTTMSLVASFSGHGDGVKDIEVFLAPPVGTISDVVIVAPRLTLC